MINLSFHGLASLPVGGQVAVGQFHQILKQHIWPSKMSHKLKAAGHLVREQGILHVLFAVLVGTWNYKKVYCYI